MDIEKIYLTGFTNYISPSKYKLMDNWTFESWEFGGGKSEETKIRIKELIKEGKKVKCGYICTSIRGYHDYFIIYK